MLTKALLLGVGLTAAALGLAEARDQIRVVGSSTVFPFSMAVANSFGLATGHKTPIVESTGTAGGFRLFCAGVGDRYPDIVNASRPMAVRERQACAANGVDAVTEVAIGFDGIVLVNAQAGQQFAITLDQLWLALAQTVPVDRQLVPNPHQRWSDVDPALPALPIAVLGPPRTSATRDAFEELAMERGCLRSPADQPQALGADGSSRGYCRAIRRDGVYLEAGEDDDRIVARVAETPGIFGILGFSFLARNAGTIHGSAIDGVFPDYAAIADGTYPLSRRLYFYVKNAHAGRIPDLAEFAATFASEAAIGPEGFLRDHGLIPLSDAERRASAAAAIALIPLQTVGP